MQIIRQIWLPSMTVLILALLIVWKWDILAVSSSADPHELRGPQAAIAASRTAVRIVPACEYSCPRQDVLRLPCTAAALVDKYGPPEKVHVAYLNHGSIHELNISSDVKLLYPNKGMDFIIGKATWSAIERTMQFADYECYPPTSLETYIDARDDEPQQAGLYWTNFKDWIGFIK